MGSLIYYSISLDETGYLLVLISRPVFFWEEPYLFNYYSDQIIRRVSPMRMLRVFFSSVTSLHAVDNLFPTRLLEKCYRVGLLAHFVQKCL